MAKRIAAFMILIFLSCVVFAQESALEMKKKHKPALWREKQEQLYSMSFSLGGTSEFAAGYFRNGESSGRDWEIRSSDTFIEDMYQDYRGAVWTTGAMGAEFNWNFSRWWNLSAYLGFTPFWTKLYDAMTSTSKGNSFGVAVTAMPKIKVMYCNRPMVRLYTDFALGLALYPGFSKLDSKAGLACQFNMIGIEVGRKWYGTAEIGLGTVFTGASAGFGFKF